MNDKSWDNKTIQLFDKLELQIRQQQAEIDYWKNMFEKAMGIAEKKKINFDTDGRC